MKRHVWGVLAATAAVPYLTAFLMTAFDLLFLIKLGSEGLWIFSNRFRLEPLLFSFLVFRSLFPQAS